MNRTVPRTMSTQHPDNVHMPFFADGSVIEGEDEIKEAFYAFSHIRSREQLWDFEGKEVDNYVVKKLLSRYENFFSRNKLGRDIFLTFRVPNPTVEKNEAKVLIETLESIPRSYDAAKTFYGSYDDAIAPVFEVAQPMTSDSISLIRIKEYYRKIVVGKESTSIADDDVPIRSWIGEFCPKEINVIPLFEDTNGILNAHSITREYLQSMRDMPEYQRVWLARSDPALNYSSLAATLLNKIALKRLEDLENELSVAILPILGTGSAPFRGNLKPTNSYDILRAYPSVQTFTIQSAFKYDYPEKQVFESVSSMEESKRGKATAIGDEDKIIDIIRRLSAQYQKEINLLAGIVNDFARFIPSRRKRKLHIGLFGYSRSVGELKLPRAITFCASLYSMGLPPELLGLSALSGKDLETVRESTSFFDKDMEESLRYLNKDNLRYFPKSVQDNSLKISGMFKHEPDPKHQKITGIIMDDYSKGNFNPINENIIRAASIRGFLG
ncbi:MAG: phosphoenolpyruvate carboxylase [Candidatus Micrarchaeota archaeon]|nr:phosphoenolpyruvate carboxylase [Candidatus Micrarchaeota archaeon]